MPLPSIPSATSTPTYRREPFPTATFANSMVALGAQSAQAGVVSAMSWGLRSALISVGGQLGGIAGPLISNYYSNSDPADTTIAPATDNPNAYASAQAIGTLVGKLTAVCVGAVILGPAQAIAESLCIAARRGFGEGFQYNIPSRSCIVQSQRLTERAFCGGSLVRPPLEQPLLPAQPKPSIQYMAEVATLDMVCSGGISAGVQVITGFRDWTENGGVKGELIPVEANFTRDINLLQRGAKTVVNGAAFDLIPGLLPFLTPVLPTKMLHAVAPILNTLMPVCGTVFRLDTWFALARPAANGAANLRLATQSRQDAKAILPGWHPRTPHTVDKLNRQPTLRNRHNIIRNTAVAPPQDHSPARRTRTNTWPN
jgi:hypothetical protein